MKKIIFTAFFILSCSLFSDPLTSQIETDSRVKQIKYIKIGSDIGAGYRLHKNAHGFDLSANYASMFGETWTSGKALYLFYPFSSSGNYFYMGAGPGITYGTLDIESSISPLLSNGTGRYSIHKSKLYPTLETTLGYEFFTGEKVTLFTQIDLSIPFDSEPLPLFIGGPGEGWKPAISLGIGF